MYLGFQENDSESIRMKFSLDFSLTYLIKIESCMSVIEIVSSFLVSYFNE